jgi:hypothetical protein
MIVKAGANGKEQYQIRQRQKKPKILPPHVFTVFFLLSSY